MGFTTTDTVLLLISLAVYLYLLDRGLRSVEKLKRFIRNQARGMIEEDDALNALRSVVLWMFLLGWVFGGALSLIWFLLGCMYVPGFLAYFAS